jgi:hypothetical protein
LNILDHYKIDQKGANSFNPISNKKSYGQPLTAEQLNMVTFSPIIPLAVGETVVWKDHEDDEFYYGVITAIESEDREFLTDVTLEANHVTVTISSIYVYKFIDELHQEAPINVVVKMIDKLLKEIELVNERSTVREIQKEIVHRVRVRWSHSTEIIALLKKVEFELEM